MYFQQTNRSTYWLSPLPLKSPKEMDQDFNQNMSSLSLSLSLTQHRTHARLKLSTQTNALLEWICVVELATDHQIQQHFTYIEYFCCYFTECRCKNEKKLSFSLYRFIIFGIFHWNFIITLCINLFGKPLWLFLTFRGFQLVLKVGAGLGEIFIIRKSFWGNLAWIGPMI